MDKISEIANHIERGETYPGDIVPALRNFVQCELIYNYLLEHTKNVNTPFMIRWRRMRSKEEAA